MLKGLALLLFILKSQFTPCHHDKHICHECNKVKYKIRRTGSLPSEIKEASGVEVIDSTIFLHSDSGNDPFLWNISIPEKKNTPASSKIDLSAYAKNIDWEDITSDNHGNIFIGDFGNNGNYRKNLCILKYNPCSDSLSKINFSYPDQFQYPPSKIKNRTFDCEAIFWMKGNLYLVSKNKYNPIVKVYQLPDVEGNYLAKPVTTIRTPFPVTAADISQDNKTLALLSYGKVIFYKIDLDENGNFQLVPLSCKNFFRSGQAEAITFYDQKKLLIINEKGKIYTMIPKKKEY